MAGKPTVRWKRLGKTAPFAGVLSLLLVCVFSLAAYSPIYPDASGADVAKSNSVMIDYSHADLGYVMIKHKGSEKKLMIQIHYDGDLVGQYGLNGQNRYEVYPLPAGSGTYRVRVFEQVKSSKYTTLIDKKVKADMPDPNTTFLVPNQYTWYDPNTKAVQKGAELCAGLTTDREKMEAVFSYVSTNVMYDYVKAVTVQAGYVPTVDETLDTGMGICFDYAALFGCMLRSQGVPTKMVIGNMTSGGADQRHAWSEVLVDGEWVMLDPTFASIGAGKAQYIPERYQ